MKPVITTAKARNAQSFIRSATAPETIDIAVEGSDSPISAPIASFSITEDKAHEVREELERRRGTGGAAPEPVPV